MSDRYIVFAYYPHLGIKVRVTSYSSKDEMYEYLSGLRMCDTPYQAIDRKVHKVIDKCLNEANTEKVIQIIEEMLNIKR